MRISKTIALFLGLTLFSSYAIGDDCSNFNGEMGCSSGTATTYPDTWAERSFQTFLPGDANYKDSYEGLGRIMCYSSIAYASDRKSATVNVKCKQHSTISSLQYNFNDKGF